MRRNVGRSAIVGIGVVLLLIGARTSVRGDLPSSPRTPGDVSPLPVIGAVPDFALRSLEGPGVRLRDLRGKVVVLTFGCSHCTDEPVAVVEGFGRLQQALKGRGIFGRKVVLVFVVRHPDRETGTGLRMFAARIGVDPYGWLILGGSPQVTEHLRDRFGRLGADGTPGPADTRGRVFLMDYAGRVRRVYTPETFRVDAVLADMERLL